VIAENATPSEVQEIQQWVDGTAVDVLLLYAMIFALRGRVEKSSRHSP